MRAFLICIFYLVFFPGVSSQTLRPDSIDPRIKKPLGINILAGGPTYLAAELNYFITPILNVNISYAPIDGLQGVSLGLRIYKDSPDPTNRWSTYLGIEWARLNEDLQLGLCFGSCSGSELSIWYLPAGISRIAKSGFMMSFEAAMMSSYNLTSKESDYYGPWARVSFGYRF